MVGEQVSLWLTAIRKLVVLKVPLTILTIQQQQTQPFLFIVRQTNEKKREIYFVAIGAGGFLLAFVRRENIICVTNSKTNDFRGNRTNSARDGIRQGLINFFLRLLPVSRTLTSNRANDSSHTFSVRRRWQNSCG